MDLFPMRRRSSYETWAPRNFRGIHAAPSPVASSASLRSLPLAILAALEYKSHAKGSRESRRRRVTYALRATPPSRELLHAATPPRCFSLLSHLQPCRRGGLIQYQGERRDKFLNLQR